MNSLRAVFAVHPYDAPKPANVTGRDKDWDDLAAARRADDGRTRLAGPRDRLGYAERARLAR
jgi:hypothetical protein